MNNCDKSFLLTYNENDEKEWSDMEDETHYQHSNFIKIDDLLKIKGLKDLVKGCPDKFLELLQKSFLLLIGKM